MKQLFIKQDSYQTLLLFFAGWGMDEAPFIPYQPQNHDFMICYDYQDLFFDYDLVKSYNGIKVVAWSMGVWAASKIIPQLSSQINESIAINGTLSPISNYYGIPISIFEGTLENFNETTLHKFQRRMCGSSDVLNDYLSQAPKRSIESLYQELAIIKQLSVVKSGTIFRAWDKVYIGINDKIFPAKNQQSAWKGTNSILIDAEHYPIYLWKEILS